MWGKLLQGIAETKFEATGLSAVLVMVILGVVAAQAFVGILALADRFFSRM